MSKVSVPVKNQQEEEKEEEVLNKEVPSVIKVKPRTIPPNVKQANKNLLLKAVAEAQKSLASAPSVGNSIKVSCYNFVFLLVIIEYLWWFIIMLSHNLSTEKIFSFMLKATCKGIEQIL